MTNTDETLRAELIAYIDSKLNKPQPEKGEWWYGGNGNIEFILKVKKVTDSRVDFYEWYDKEELDTNEQEWESLEYLSRPATQSEIEYYMGLHAQRLGIKEGVTVDRSGLDDFGGKATIMGNGIEYLAEYDYFIINGVVIRDSSGTWAKVVESKVVVNNNVVTYHTKGCRIEDVWFDKDQIRFLSQDVFPDHEGLKTIFGGFPK